MTKKVWRKPEVKSMRAGDAEQGNPSTISDSGNNKKS